MKELTAKQQAFVDEYISNGANGAKAYGKIYGQKESARISASRLLSKDNISAEIQKRLEEVKSDRTADLQEVLKMLTATLRGEMSDTIVVNVGVGRGYTKTETVTIPAPTSDKLKAASIMMKYFTQQKGESEPVTEIRIIRAGKQSTE